MGRLPGLPRVSLMSNTGAMEKRYVRPNGVAPSSSRYKVGAKGGDVARAWQYIWDRLDRHTFKDGQTLAAEAGRVFHLMPISIMSHLHRMAQEGILETEVKPAQTVVLRGGKEHDATRRRTHFRIAADVPRVISEASK